MARAESRETCFLHGDLWVIHFQKSKKKKDVIIAQGENVLAQGRLCKPQLDLELVSFSTDCDRVNGNDSWLEEEHRLPKTNLCYDGL